MDSSHIFGELTSGFGNYIHDDESLDSDGGALLMEEA